MYINGIIGIIFGLVIICLNKPIAQKLYESDMRLRRIKSMRKRLHEGDMGLIKKADDYRSHSKRYRITTIAIGLVLISIGCLDLMDSF